MGDKLVELLKIMKGAIMNHVHPWAGMEQCGDWAGFINKLEGYDMDKEELKENIFEYVKTVGTLSSKGDVLGDEPIEDKVYTKKVNIGENYGYGANRIKVACVSLTSSTEDFKDAAINNVRINTKNRQEQWCNIFINEAPKDMLELIWKKIDRLES